MSKSLATRAALACSDRRSLILLCGASRNEGEAVLVLVGTGDAVCAYRPAKAKEQHFLKCTLNVLPSHRLSDCEYAFSGHDQKNNYLHEPSVSACCRLGIRGRSLNIFQRWMDGFLRHADALASMGFPFKVVGLAGWKREKSKSDRDNFAACTAQMLQVFPCQSARQPVTASPKVHFDVRGFPPPGQPKTQDNQAKSQVLAGISTQAFVA